ncbi:MAG: hypothetical protein FJX75_15300 [Armatimonadetes bacterium]|nr:hypothetical protein [Armatimonadota bacterium]
MLVREDAERGYTARVLSLPLPEISARTEAEAIAGAQAAIADTLRGARVVEVDVDVPSHPWAALAGIYEGDEQFERVLEEIEAYRKVLSSQELAEWDSDRGACRADDRP